jgi:hypothetical protein
MDNEGEFNEMQAKPILESFFNTTLTKSKDKYDEIDFYGYNIGIEVKSRKANLQSFTSWFVGYNKIKKLLAIQSKNPDFRAYIVYVLNNGTFYFELTKKSFDQIGGINCVEETVFKIPKECLTLLSPTHCRQKISGVCLLKLPKKNNSKV